MRPDALKLVPIVILVLSSLMGGEALAQNAGSGTVVPVDAAQAAASDTALAWPDGMSMPLRIVGIDDTDKMPARTAIPTAERALAAAWLAAPQPFTRFVFGRRPITLNRARLTDRVLTGKPTTVLPAPSVVVEPTWCSLMDRHLLFVTVADAAKNELLGSAHVSIPRAQWKPDQLATRLPALARQALARAASRGATPKADALHVGLDLGRNLTRMDEGSSACVGLLLEEKLGETYTVARLLGTDILATTRDVLEQPATLRRPTRRVVMRWTNPPESKPNRKLPVTMEMVATFVDSVGGRSIPLGTAAQKYEQKTQWTLTPAADGTIQFSVPAELTAFLEGEKKALALADGPQVAKVRGAWVYVDRGRAWGLKMGDRLVSGAEGGATVKGHVVRYFGAEEKLRSPRGFPINEGAILYVRKGQKLTSVGQEFRFDPRTFPTPWPPQGSAPEGGP